MRGKSLTSVGKFITVTWRSVHLLLLVLWKLLAIFGRKTARHPVAKKTVRVVKRGHSKTVGKAHRHLASRWGWYRRWHSHRWHPKVHYGLLGVYLVALALALSIFRSALAADLTHVWNFAVGGDYSTSSGAEIASSTGRLKVQNYANDANTMALYHLDENTGSSAGDSSSNANTGTITGGAWQTGSLNYSLTLNGSSTYISTADSASLSLTGANTIEAWTKFGSLFSANSHSGRQVIVDKGAYQLYYDNQTGKVTYELERSGQTGWTQQGGGKAGGGSVKNSWDRDGKAAVRAQVAVGSDIYVGLGSPGATNPTGDAELWKCASCATAPIWTMIGGDGINSGWVDDVYDQVNSLAASGSYVYAGLGNSVGDAELWRWNGSAWTKIGGDSLSSSWASNYQNVGDIVASGTTLYVGIQDGSGTTESAVWRCTSCDATPTWTELGNNTTWSTTYSAIPSLELYGSTLIATTTGAAGAADIWSTDTTTISWTRIAGEGSGAGGQSWGAGIELAGETVIVGNILYVGLGNSTTDADVWKCDLSGTCSNTAGWTQIGGDGLNSSWNTNYEAVRSIAADGSGNVYAGLGDSAGDNEVWKWNGTAWSQIGGDGLNSGWVATGNAIDSMLVLGSNLYAGEGGNGTPLASELYKTDLTTISWSRVGGQYFNNSWGYYGYEQIESSAQGGGYLYFGMGATSGDAMVWRFDGSTWTLIGGAGINSSWAYGTYGIVYSLAAYNGNLYAGLGNTAGLGEVWKWNGSAWTKVGGDGLNSSFSSSYDSVRSMVTSGTTVYAGIGDSGSEAEVWKCTTCDTSPSWSQVGGDSINSSWTSAGSYDYVGDLMLVGNYLVAGLGWNVGDAEVYKMDLGTGTWSKIGGDGTATGGQSWASNYDSVNAISAVGNVIYVGLSGAGGDAAVWSCDISATCSVTAGWTKIGGAGVNSSWSDPSITTINSMAAYNGRLYAATGGSFTYGEVWAYDGSSWVRAGGIGDSGWFNSIDNVHTLNSYKGKLYAGLGDSANIDHYVLSYGNNGFLQSTSTSQDTAWHHIAATYDGTTMKLYRDGSLDGTLADAFTIPDNSQSLYVGTAYGSRGDGVSQPYFSGSIDELRISNIARSSFTTKPYSTGNETVRPVTAVYSTGVATWDSFATSETLNGGTVKFRLSYDGGSTWKYWDGSAWATSTTLAEVNLASVINTNVATFPVTSSGLLWQAVLLGNGDQRVTLNSVTVTATSDTSPPSNPSSASGKDTVGGLVNLTSGNWYNYASPYFTWTPPADPPSGSGGVSGVAGYYVYFGTDASADPLTAGTFQTAANYMAGLMTSGSTYYLRIKAKDVAGNTNASAAALFTYKLDSVAPAAVDYVNVSPVGCSTSSLFNFSWPTSSDANSGIVGYDYRLGSTGTIQNTTAETAAAPAYQVGDNVFYVRAKDNAGNVSAFQTGIYCSTEVAVLVDGPTVVAGPSTLTVSWTSNKPTTSFVRVQDGNTYISEHGQSSLSINHSVKVVGLEPEKAYKYKLVWTDAGGNLGESPFFETSTSTAPALRNFSSEILSPTSLLLSWQTTELSSAVVEYGIGSYSTTKVINGSATSFTSQLTGLSAGSNYQIRVAARTADGYPYFYSVSVQTPPLPIISNLRFDYLPEAQASVRVSWTTNVPSTSLVRYTAAGGATKTASSAELVTDHSITLTDLLDDTEYVISAQSTDKFGNTGVSDSQKYSTPFDTRVPKIANMSVEIRSNGNGTAQKAQIVVSWETDEPSTGQIEYGPGIASTSYPSKSQEDKALSTSHVIIVSELEPARLYHLRAVSNDRSGNQGTSLDTTVITGKAQRSVIDLIINSLQRSLSFLTKLPLLGR